MLKTKEKIAAWLNEMGIEDYFIQDDLTVNVEGNVNLKCKKLWLFPVNFGFIRGNFDCSYNYLISLKGCPQTIMGEFYCNRNELISLRFGPTMVDSHFDCATNYIKSLKWLPKFLGGDLICPDNKLKSLYGCPELINGTFDCSRNLLYFLKGGPKVVNEDFFCSDNFLTSFKGIPHTIGKNFYGSGNKFAKFNVDDFFSDIGEHIYFRQNLIFPELESLYNKDLIIDCDLYTFKKTLNAYKLNKKLHSTLSKKNKIFKSTKI